MHQSLLGGACFLDGGPGRGLSPVNPEVTHERTANLYTLVSDTVPRQAVGSVVGIGGMAGSVAGMFFAQVVSRVLQFTNNNYLVPFCLAASPYLLALILIHLLLPRLEAMPLERVLKQDSAGSAPTSIPGVKP